MFGFAFVMLMFFALGVLLFGGAGVAFGAGWLLVLPFLIFFKIALFFLLFGALGRMVWHRGGWDRRGWDSAGEWQRRGPSRRRSEEPDRSAEDRFEEWHRLAHARQEVDGWVPGVDDGENG